MAIKILKMIKLKYRYLPILVLPLFVFLGCQKDGNPNKLGEVSKADYEGTVEGYKSSDDVFSKNLVAYWPFDENNNEKITNTPPTSTQNDALVADGLKGKALSLNAGVLYYAKQFDAFKTEAFKSFTISTWVQIQNNGAKKTMLFQLARPTRVDGNINFILETNAYPTTDSTRFVIHPTFADAAGGFQDNLNAPFMADFRSPPIGKNTWTHIVLTYESETGIFSILGNAENIGSFSNRGVGNSSFKSNEPNEVIIGGNYNAITGKVINGDVSYAAMTGKIDEIRIYNTVLPSTQIKALYNLGKAGK